MGMAQATGVRRDTVGVEMNFIMVLEFDERSTDYVRWSCAPSQAALAELPSDVRRKMADTLRTVADNLERLG